MSMKKILYTATMSVLMSAVANMSLAQTATLSEEDSAVVAIAAHTASGDLNKLENSLKQGLESGLTVNEIKEELVQLYAYTGFPRSLNAINRFMTLMQEREKAGIKDEIGKEPSEVPANLNKDEYGARVRARLGGRDTIAAPSGYQLFAPAIDTFLKEHLFCDIFIRDNLDERKRELATVGALAAMTGTEGQLVFHLNAAMNTGTTPDQMKHFVQVIEKEVGQERSAVVEKVLDRVLSTRQQ